MHITDSVYKLNDSMSTDRQETTGCVYGRRKWASSDSCPSMPRVWLVHLTFGTSVEILQKNMKTSYSRGYYTSLMADASNIYNIFHKVFFSLFVNKYFTSEYNFLYISSYLVTCMYFSVIKFCCPSLLSF